MYLLYQRILKDIPDAQVFIINSWPRGELGRLPFLEERFRAAISHSTFKSSKFSGLKQSEKVFYLFDSGQSTYWDQELVNFLKNNCQSLAFDRRPHAILFCRYGGEPLGAPIGMRFSFGAATIGMNRVTGRIDLGLSLDKDEFRDVVLRFQKGFLLDAELTTFMYHFTAGHVGALIAILDFLLKTVRNNGISDKIVCR